MPRDGSAALRALQKKAEGMGIPCVLLHRELCRKTVFRPEQEIRIRTFQTRHLDKLYWDVPHFCYLLECGEKKLLFTADVDFTQEDFSAVRGMALDAVFGLVMATVTASGIPEAIAAAVLVTAVGKALLRLTGTVPQRGLAGESGASES